MTLCCLEDYEAEANRRLLPSAAGYYSSGSCSEYTLELNKQAFQRLRIRPRVLRDVVNRDLSVQILGQKVDIPIGVASAAMQKMAHPEGECANARAVGAMGSIYQLSTVSTSSIEEVAEAAPNTIKWFQLYMLKDRSLVEILIKRAVKAGFTALVLTVDASTWGVRRAEIRAKFVLPSHLRLANFTGEIATRITKETKGSALTDYVNTLFDLDITWKDVTWLKKVSGLPVILKGVMTAEDAKIAADLGVAGVIVSNHGGRQLDTCPATIEALPEVVKAAGDRIEVYLDGGIRNGTDVFKALALGAKMVFVGRPALWGLACGGEKGVCDVLGILRSEFDIAMALTGCKRISDIKPDMVVHESRYAKL